jgi:hypothetical protein
LSYGEEPTRQQVQWQQASTEYARQNVPDFQKTAGFGDPEGGDAEQKLNLRQQAVRENNR